MKYLVLLEKVNRVSSLGMFVRIQNVQKLRGCCGYGHVFCIVNDQPKYWDYSLYLFSLSATGALWAQYCKSWDFWIMVCSRGTRRRPLALALTLMICGALTHSFLQFDSSIDALSCLGTLTTPLIINETDYKRLKIAWARDTNTMRVTDIWPL